MDPTSVEESTPWDPITGRLRTGFRQPQRRSMDGTLGPARGLDATVPRQLDPTSTEESTPWDPITGKMRQNAFRQTEAHDLTQSRPRTSGHTSHSARGRDVTQQRPQTSGHASHSARGRDTTQQRPQTMQHPPSQRPGIGATLAGSATNAAHALSKAQHEPIDETSIQPSVDYNIIDDNSGHNIDADGQTMIGIEIKERFHDMRTAFLDLDENFDGRLTRDELMKACRKWNIPLSEAARVLNCADLDENGYLDFDEFAQRFDPTLKVSEDDEEILRLYQQGIMAGERPLNPAGVYFGTSTADPLIDEAAHLRKENADLRGRLARCLRTIAELEAALAQAHERNASLETSLRESRESEEELRRLLRTLEDANERHKHNEALALERAEHAEKMLRALRDQEGARRKSDMDDELECLKRRRLDQERELEELRRQRELDDALRESRRQQRDLDDTLREQRKNVQDDHQNVAMEEADESKIVFVYGKEGDANTEAMYKALKKAQVPFERRDFDKDKRFMKAMKKSGFTEGSIYCPVVCLGDKAWWYDTSADHLAPFPQEVAAELRHDLGISLMSAPVKVRVDADIDSEIYERYLTMQDAFLKLDDDKDGYVRYDELVQRCQEWHIPTSEAQRIINESGCRKSQALDFDAFAKRFSSNRQWGSRGVHRGQALTPNRVKQIPK